MHPHALSQFRALLTEHLGQELTPSLCAELELVARSAPDLSIDLAQFQPLTYGGYTIRPERFAAVVDELHPLHQLHWQETEKHRHGLPMAPNYAAMAASERAGQMLQFTARAPGGELVGHVRMYLGTSRHTQTLFGEEDTLFLHPAHRGGFLVMALMRYAEQALRQLGAREIRADSKLLNKADVLMRRLGYSPVALKFHKFLEDNHVQ